MAPHSSTLAWKIPWMEEPGRLQSMGSLRVRHDWATSLSLFHLQALEKEMATHSSILAWRIPGAGEPGGLTSTGSHRVRHNWSDLAVAVLWLLSICLLRTYRPQGIADKLNKISLLSKLAEIWSFLLFISFYQSFLYPLDRYSKMCSKKIPCWIPNYTGQQRRKSFNSVQFSRSVVSDSWRPHEPQQVRPPCPSPAPGVHPNPCPLSQWCHPAISSCPQSFPASGSFQMS